MIVYFQETMILIVNEDHVNDTVILFYLGLFEKSDL